MNKKKETIIKKKEIITNGKEWNNFKWKKKEIIINEKK